MADARTTLPATLRIALVGPLPPPAGGMANQTRQLAGLLRADAIDVKVIQVNAPYRPAWLGQLRGARALARLLPYMLRLWGAAGRADLLHVMANSGWSWHLFAAPAIVIGRLRGCGVLVNYRGGEAETFFARSFRYVRPVLRLAHSVAVPSGFLKAVFARYGAEAVIIPNIVNLERFAPEKHTIRRSGGGPHVVVARNLEPIYGICTALHALKHLVAAVPGVRLSVAGTGPQYAELEDLSVKLGLKETVTFTGRLDPDGMAALYRSADLVLNPSLADNMPNSVLEALASGVPVVSTDVGGVPYLVRDGETAVLVPPDDPVRLAEATMRVLGDPGLYGRLSENGIAEVGRYTWAAVRPKLYEEYGRVLSATAGRRPTREDSTAEAEGSGYADSRQDRAG